MENQYNFEIALLQLKESVKKDEKRKACKDCGELGHNNMKNNSCILKITHENIIKNKIKKYILSLDCLTNDVNDELFERLSLELNISSNLSKRLYTDIPAEELLQRTMDIESYIQKINKINCFECDCVLLELQKNTTKKWKGNSVCDLCWCSHSEEREGLWGEIKNYRVNVCCVCDKRQNHGNERFHYDHLNMFEKNDSICSMVGTGDNIMDIYDEIDKCQIVCLPCHHLITDIENKIGFTRIKTSLTKKFNNEELSREEYDNGINYYQDIYKEKMLSIYNQLKL